MKIFLTGFMGAGKSTTGKRLASRLGFSFSDIDSLIEAEEQMPVSGIFIQKGEAYFREKELQTLYRFAGIQKAVIATGGGLPCFGRSMDWMNNNGITVYLQLSAEMLFSRLRQGRDHRPLIREKSDDQLIDYIRETLAVREEYYLKADIIAEGFNTDAERIALAILNSTKFQKDSR